MCESYEKLIWTVYDFLSIINTQLTLFIILQREVVKSFTEHHFIYLRHQIWFSKVFQN